MKKKISITINEKLISEIDLIIDNIFIRNRSQAIEYLLQNSLGENKVAVILCGGDEKKLLLEKDIYRPTALIDSKTVIEHSIKKLRENGFKTIYLVARHKILTRAFEILKDGSSYGAKVNYIEEKQSFGSADSLKAIKGKVTVSFLVVYGDILFSKIKIDQLWNSHLKSNAMATLLLTTSPKPSEKGTIKMEGNKILEFTQKPKISDIYLVFSPIFVADPEILNYQGHSLETDIFPKLAKEGLLSGYVSSEKEIHIHSKEDIKKWT